MNRQLKVRIPIYGTVVSLCCFVVLFRRRLTESEKYLPGERIPMHQGGAEDLTFGSHNTLSIDFDAQRSVHTGIIAGI